MRLSILPGLIALLLGQSALAAQTEETRCHQMYQLTDLAHAIEPGRLVPATATTPAYCRVRGVVNRAIRFEVTMPVADWNRRFMFSTVGGAAGTIGDTTSLLARGFAMASTDTGHEAVNGTEFYEQPEALIDYAYRGVHLATLAAKTTISRYYGKKIKYSYLSGCSNGGRAAMLEAERYPEEYDGIIAGAPLFRFQEMYPWMLGVARAQQANPLDVRSLLVLDRASKAACDTLDGVADGVINDPRECTADIFDVTSLKCTARKTTDCLTEGEVKTALAVYGDVVDAAGKVVSPGVMPGAEAAGDWAFWQLPNGLSNGESIVSGVGDMIALLQRFVPTFDIDKFNAATDRDQIADTTAVLDVVGDLSEFRKAGGKLLMYQGWNDFPLRPQRAINYLDDIETDVGSAKDTARFFRLFMVPGMAHCAGGPGAWQADYVDPIVAWREKGTAPERIEASQPGPMDFGHLVPAPEVAPTEKFTRPLCVYPALAQYGGSGDTSDAQNFTCAVPR